MILLWLDINCSFAHSSLALPALHAQAAPNEKEWQWYVASGTIHTPYIHYLKKAIELQPDVVAATAWLFTHNRLLEVVSRIKAVLPNTYIILGGPEFWGGNEAYLKAHPFIDAVFRGEGEEVISPWLTHWGAQEIRDCLPGMCTLDADGVYHDHGAAKVARFEMLIPPETSPFFPLNKPFIQIETTRGCFNDCYFCVSGGDKPIRTYSIASLRMRLQRLVESGVKEIRILDRTFNVHPKRTSALLHLFAEFSGALRFHIEIHPALLTDELFDILQSLPHGLLHIEAGIQSLDDRVLSSSGRVGDCQKAMDGVRRLAECNRFEVHADLIAGLPNYTLKRIKEDVKKLISFRLDEVQLELLKVLPGTQMRNKATSLEIRYAPTPPYEVLATPAISSDELYEAQQLSRLLDGWYNGKSEWRELFVEITLVEPCFLDDFLHELMQKQLLEQPLSAERRGVLLYDFCTKNYPAYLPQISAAWIMAGHSLNKGPGQRATPCKEPPQQAIFCNEPPQRATPCKEPHQQAIRYWHLPTPSGGYWFGFDRAQERRRPSVILREPPTTSLREPPTSF